MAASSSTSSSSAETNLATAKALLSTAASVAATIMLARSVAQDFIPHELHDYLFARVRKFFKLFSSSVTMVVDEFDGLASNQIYDAADTYLASKVDPSTERLNVSKPDKENRIRIRMESHEEVSDEFQGVIFKWVLISRQIELSSMGRPDPMGYSSSSTLILSQLRSFEVSFPKEHKEMAIQSYFPYILREAKAMKHEKKTLKIFTVQAENLYGNMSEAWSGVNLDHPATFDTLAMDVELKRTILKDLERFSKRKDYYRRVGKAWKRGYLFYGPPGTGKSSLIAAMANYLNFDIYDLELTELRQNSELRKLIIATANRSILVVEDIDCTIDLQNRSVGVEPSDDENSSGDQPRVTLSGFLNFTDGLWSSCGDERIIVFTTNHKEKLDPALLRPGRMDMHINLSYCNPCGFRILAMNYLGLTDHGLFPMIDELISMSEVTTAEIAEQLMRNDDHDPEGTLTMLIEFLRSKDVQGEATNGELETVGGEEIENVEDEAS